jgi:methionyl-tRNA formyltransferase
VLVDTLVRYIRSGQWEFELPNNLGGETYYIIHPVLKHIAILAKDN